MGFTDQIINQIDSLVQNISSYCNAIQAENQRASKAKTDINNRFNAQKSQIQKQTDSQVKEYRNALQATLNSLNSTRQEVDSFERELSRLIPRNKVPNIQQTNERFSKNDARELISKIREKGFWAWLKKILTWGSYDSNKNMAAELYGKIDGYYVYHSGKVSEAEQKCKNQVSACQLNGKKKIASLELQNKQELQNEIVVHSSKVRSLAQMEQKILSDPQLTVLQKKLDYAKDFYGVKSESWQKYTPANKLPEDLLLGIILYPCKIATPSAEAKKLLQKIHNYAPSSNGFIIPLTVPMSSPILMYADCESTDVRLAASVFQSVIARMIRFMPPKSIKSIFFDSVNRGTSLGQLIDLSGEGTGQVCEYYLNPQDINKQMNNLTKHVDKICNRLTSAGCNDINAYNSIPKVARIPYTSVIIHDYPNGFDSTSLGYLEVLINKAKQCGISIMISHKQRDKVENKALDVLNLINKKFDCLKISANAQAQLIRGKATYDYKPCIVNISKNYLGDINKLFTYKPPIENGFSKFFGSKMPAYRDSTKGLDIPFAVDANGEVIDLKIGYDLSAYGFISGGVGSGKTTLLHMLITSAIMHYKPSDLELWLVDYKEAEFAFYTRNCPPHVRYVVADNSSEISYSIIDEIKEEIDRRAKLFISVQVKDFVEYRESNYGKNNPLPRLLIIIDEFHRMAQAAQDETEYKTVMENIFAEARSHGVVLLLCDQQISNGLSGLSTKSKDLICVRIALRNKPDEIRETLAVEASQITDDVKKKILDNSSGQKGSAIYKYEEKDKNDEFANKVVFRSCRGIFADTKERTKVITEICQKYSNFDRDKTFFVGAVRQHMNISQLKGFEKKYPQNVDRGERFYIGTPLGIQPCFFFELKPAESGENILLVGNNHEKRISLLKAVLSCAGRYGYKIKIFASRGAQLYRQNKGFFDALSNAEIITSFPEICKYVGETANRLKSMYSDDEDDFETSETNNAKNMVIFVGLDEIYAQMEASPLNQKTAWTVSEPQDSIGNGVRTVSEPQNATSNTISSNDANSLSESKGSTGPSEVVDSATVMNEGLATSMDNIDKLLASLNADMGSDDYSMTVQVNEKFAGPCTSGIKGYNAVSDLAMLLSDGWKMGINSMVVVDRGTVFNKMRQVKLDGNFNHRISLVMSPDEAQCFMTKTKTMKSLIDSGDSISAVYEYLGGREQCFRPYVFD